MVDMDDENLIGALQDIDRGLSEWEMNFIDSITTFYENRGTLTDKQRKIAERIWREKG